MPRGRAQRGVSRHGAVLILRDARTPVRVCESPPACALLRMRTAEPAARRRTVRGHSISRCQTAHLVPAARFPRPGLATLLHSPRVEGWAERRESFGCCAEHPLGLHITRQARRLARRLASHDAGRSPLGAPPWRPRASPVLFFGSHTRPSDDLIVNCAVDGELAPP